MMEVADGWSGIGDWVSRLIGVGVGGADMSTMEGLFNAGSRHAKRDSAV